MAGMKDLLFLLLFTVSAEATEMRAKNAKEWDNCEEKVRSSKAAKRADYLGGKTGVEDFVVEKCGPRPILISRDGSLVLHDEDCESLFGWSTAGACTPESTWGLSMLIRKLDQRVFDEKKYMERCASFLGSETADTYPAFRAKICEVPALRDSLRSFRSWRPGMLSSIAGIGQSD